MNTGSSTRLKQILTWRARSVCWLYKETGTSCQDSRVTPCQTQETRTKLLTHMDPHGFTVLNIITEFGLKTQTHTHGAGCVTGQMIRCWLVSFCWGYLNSDGSSCWAEVKGFKTGSCLWLLLSCLSWIQTRFQVKEPELLSWWFQDYCVLNVLLFIVLIKTQLADLIRTSCENV